MGINERVQSFGGESEAVTDEVALSLRGMEDCIVVKIANFEDRDEDELPKKGVFTGDQLRDQKVACIMELHNNGSIVV